MGINRNQLLMATSFVWRLVLPFHPIVRPQLIAFPCGNGLKLGLYF
jgi:hypothetical protein